MDVFGHLALGFGVALTPINLLYALVGVLVGTLIGPAGNRTGGDDRDAVADNLRPAACRR
jgi:hypothetical protein